MLGRAFGIIGHIHRATDITNLSTLEITGNRGPSTVLLGRAFRRLNAACVGVNRFVTDAPSLFPHSCIGTFRDYLSRAAPLSCTCVRGMLGRRLTISNVALSSGFTRVSPRPLTSTSVTRIRTTHLRGNSRMMLGIRGPNIRAVVRASLNMLRNIAGLIRLLVPSVGFTDVTPVVSRVHLHVLTRASFVTRTRGVHSFRRFLTMSKGAHIMTPAMCRRLAAGHILAVDHLCNISVISRSMVHRCYTSPTRMVTSALGA